MHPVPLARARQRQATAQAGIAHRAILKQSMLEKAEN